MGLHDRDYMRRDLDEDGANASSSDEKLEAFFSGFLRRHPRVPMVIGVVLVVVLVVTVVVVKLAGKGG